MTRINWAQIPRIYESGIDRGVLYSVIAQPWNGLVSISETNDVVERDIYFDGVRINAERQAGLYSANIECYTYPEAIETRGESFGLSYRTSSADGYKINLIYNAYFSDVSKNYKQKDPTLIPVRVTTKPVHIPKSRPTSRLIIDVAAAPASFVEALEEILYGTDLVDGRLPSPEEIITLFWSDSDLIVTDNGDGTFSIDGPDAKVYMTGTNTWEINSDAASFTGPDTWEIVYDGVTPPSSFDPDITIISDSDGTFSVVGPDSKVYMTGTTTWEINSDAAVFTGPDTYEIMD